MAKGEGEGRHDKEGKEGSQTWRCCVHDILVLTTYLQLNTGSTNLVNGWIGFYIAPSGDMGSERQLNMTRNDQISAAPNSHITKTWTVTIPADAAAGAYWLTIACWDSSWNTLWYVWRRRCGRVRGSEKRGPSTAVAFTSDHCRVLRVKNGRS